MSKTDYFDGSLRAHLRRATSASHSRLDKAMRSASGWHSRRDYAHFLTLQFRARQSVEAWLSTNATDRLRPPEQCHLIAKDLKALGANPPDFTPRFSPRPMREEDRSAFALGVTWVLAGSALGNKSILADMRRMGRGDWPTSFLGDEAMLRCWREMRPLIEEPAEPHIAEFAAMAATSVFDHFIVSTCAGQKPTSVVSSALPSPESNRVLV